ncbi:MAG: class I SAM-dependent methyltransferase [Phycisphaerales bacterium]
MPILGTRIRKLYEGTRGDAYYQDRDYWNRSLLGWASSYLGGTLNVDLRDSITSLLAKRLLPGAESILDLGCGGATLALRLGPEFTTYWGVDISDVAISKAREHLLRGSESGTTSYHFDVASVQEFQPSGNFDVIVFNEILYYVSISEVTTVLRRYCQFLSPGGLIIISLKNHALSRLVQSTAAQELQFVHGVLYQEKYERPTWNITWNSAAPGFLVQAFRAKRSG